MIGVDVNEESLFFCRKHKIYDKLVKHKLPLLPFKSKSIDFLICSEVIEHLSKKDGLKLLNEIDRVCRERAVVTTPNIFFHNPPGTEADKHRSNWQASNFSQSGYRVYGLGLRTPLLSNSFLKIKQALYYFFTPVSYFFPNFGGYLFCVKDFS